jgi:polysaccharide chain length determinant protein (PEP-CTERM system associated)
MKDFTSLEPIEYLRIPWKRRWYFLLAIVLVIVCTSAYAWLRPNLYRSETRVLVESVTVLDDPLSPAATRDRTEERVNAIRQLLESRSILERIIEEFRLRANEPSILMEDSLKAIRNNLEISKTSGSTFTMAYYATDPQAAQVIMRRLAEILIQTNQAAQKNKAMEKDQFMEQELRQAELDLTTLDDKLKQFKASHLGELPEQATANMTALNGLHGQLVAIDTALDRAREQQKMLEFRLQEQKRLSAFSNSLTPPNSPLPLEVQLAAKRSQLAEITARYTSKHPDVVRLSKEIKDLEQQVNIKNGSQAASSTPSAHLTPMSAADAKPPNESTSAPANGQSELTSEAEIAQDRYELEVLNKTIARREKEREDILKSISVYQDRLNLAPALEQELLAITREHEMKRQQVANLQARKFNAQMAANAVADKKNDIYRILDDASLPERPVFPARLHILLMGIGAGLVAGFVATFVREYFEPSLASEQEAAVVLKVPILISVPEIPAEPKALLKK